MGLRTNQQQKQRNKQNKITTTQIVTNAKT